MYVHMLYNKFLPLKVFDICFLHEGIAFDLRVGDKLYVVSLPFTDHLTNHMILHRFVELTLDILAQKNPFLTVALGDFNAKSSNLYNKDTTSNEGRKIEAVTLQNGLHKKLTHILNNSSLCIYLVFNS